MKADRGPVSTVLAESAKSEDYGPASVCETNGEGSTPKAERHVNFIRDKRKNHLSKYQKRLVSEWKVSRECGLSDFYSFFYSEMKS